MRLKRLLFNLFSITAVGMSAQSVSINEGSLTYESIDSEPGTCLVKSNATLEDVVIPATVNMNGKTYTVTTLGAFTGQVKSFTLPKTISSMGEENINLVSTPKLEYVSIDADNPFYHCAEGIIHTPDNETLLYVSRGWAQRSGHTAATTFTVASSVCHIAPWAFKTVSLIDRIELPNGLLSIGRGAFTSMPDLTDITIPSSVNNIDNPGPNPWQGLFSTCPKLKSVDFGGSIVAIPSYCFYMSLALESVKGLESVEIIHEGAFEQCVSLKDFTMPTKLRTIHDKAFSTSGIYEGQALNLPETIESIGNEAFWACKFTSATIPVGLENLPDGIFAGCRNLSKVTFSGDALLHIGSNAFQNTALEAAELPDAVVSVGLGAFENCESLLRFSTGNGLTEIGNVIKGCNNLTDITFGSSIENISCLMRTHRKIAKVTSLAVNPPTLGTTFLSDVYANATLNIPEGSLEAYKTDPNWSKFQNIVEIPKSGIVAPTDAVASISIYPDKGAALISGAEGKAVKVYSLSGSLIADTIAKSAQHRIALNPGIYVIAVESVSAKVQID